MWERTKESELERSRLDTCSKAIDDRIGLLKIVIESMSRLVILLILGVGIN